MIAKTAMFDQTEFNIADLLNKIKNDEIRYESCNEFYVFQLSAEYCRKMLWISIKKHEATIQILENRGDLCDIQHTDRIFNAQITQKMITVLQKRLVLYPTIYNL